MYLVVLHFALSTNIRAIESSEASRLAPLQRANFEFCTIKITLYCLQGHTFDALKSTDVMIQAVLR